MKLRLRFGLLWEGGRWAAWMVLVIGVVLSVTAWFFTRADVDHDARLKFQSAAIAAATTAQGQISSYANLLYGLQGLFQAEPVLNRDAFSGYVHALNFPLRYPGVRSVSYAHRLPASAKAEFERQLRIDPGLIRRGYRNVVIKPAGERSEYMVLMYTEPMYVGKAALGFDLASDDQRRVQIERLRDAGVPTLSGRLVLEIDPTRSETGLVMRLALYRKDAFVPDVESRRKAFIGLVSVTFVVGDLVERMLSREGYEKFTLNIHDLGYVDSDPKPAPEELYANTALRPPQVGAVFKHSVYVDVGQRRWELKFSAPKGHFLQTTGRVLPWAALAAVLVASLLMSGLIHSLAGSRQRAQTLAAKITTDLRVSQAKLVEEQRRTQQLIEVMPNPVYFKATDGRYLGVNKAWETFFGIARQAFLGKTVHDLYPGNPALAQRLQEDDQALWDHPGTRCLETTITTADGELHDTIFYKATFAGADGGIAGLIGTIVDITELKRTEQEIDTLADIGRIISSTPDIDQVYERFAETVRKIIPFDRIVITNIDAEMNRVTTVYMAGHEVSGRNTGMSYPLKGSGNFEMVRTRSSFLIQTEDFDEYKDRFPLLLSTFQAGFRSIMNIPFFSKGEVIGGLLLRSCKPYAYTDRDVRLAERVGDQIAGAIANAQLYAGLRKTEQELKESEQRYRELSMIDDLTQLYNSRHFYFQLKIELDRSNRYGQPLTLLLLDLDYFKAFNDAYGHVEGDQVLWRLGQTVKRCLRETDFAFRYGGEEFTILLPMTTCEEGAVTAERIRTEFKKETFFPAQDREVHVTVSIGLAQYKPQEEMKAFVHRVDQLMYQGKKNGKDRVCCDS